MRKIDIVSCCLFLVGRVCGKINSNDQIISGFRTHFQSVTEIIEQQLNNVGILQEIISPTQSPSAVPFACPAYNVSNTESASQNYYYCSFSAMPGATLTISGCNACTNDQYLSLYDENSGEQVMSNNDGCGTSKSCSIITYYVPFNEGIQNYTLHEGCYGSTACSGTVTVSGASTGVTSSGFFISPTAMPSTFMPTASFSCPPYSATNTDSATQNYYYCSFSAMPGATLTITGCNACTDDQYLTLYSLSSGYQVMSNDDGCGTSSSCSVITYVVPSYNVGLQNYTLQEGCWGTTSCSGTVTVSGASTGVTASGFVGTAAPTLMPAAVPLTAVPLTTAPVAVPVTTAPVVVPTTEVPVAVPVSVAPVVVPTTEVPVTVPVTTAPVVVPTTEVPVTVPVTTAPVVVPTTEVPVAVPVTTTPVAFVIPSVAPSTAMPSSFSCPAYSTTNTVSATQNYYYCSFSAMPGATLTITGCNACTSDQYLILYDLNSGEQVTYNDDGCGTPSSCSIISYEVPSNNVGLQNYSLHEGCYGSTSCTGTVTVSGASSGVISSGYVAGSAPSSVPNALPTTATTPSMIPIRMPTFSPNSSPVQGYLQYASWTGNACDGVKSYITGQQTNTCMLHSSGSGSYIVQFDDANCSNLRVNMYSDTLCTVYISTSPITYYAGCYAGTANTASASQTMECIVGNPVIDTNSTIFGNYAFSDITCSSNPFSFSAYTNNYCFPLEPPTITDDMDIDDDYLILLGNMHNGYMTCDVIAGEATAYLYTDPNGCMQTVAYPSYYDSVSALGCASNTYEYDDQLWNTKRPVYAPTHAPVLPTLRPSMKPSIATTTHPTTPTNPSSLPVHMPTEVPVGSPTRAPTPFAPGAPTPHPSFSSIPSRMPTEGTPSTMPHGDPSHLPTPLPSVKPTTQAPVDNTFACPFYSATNTATDNQNYYTCTFTACKGDTFTASGCGCSGDQYLELYSSTSFLRFSQDACGYCSSITYTVPQSSPTQCVTYTLNEGCQGSGSCSGTVLITGSTGSYIGSGFFTSSAPVPAPTHMPVPSVASFSGPSYSVTNTNSATQNYAYVTFTACGGQMLTLSGCGLCTGDQYIRLYQMYTGGSTQVGYNDDGCGTSGSCSLLSYIVPGDITVCSTYSLHEGCYSSGSCTGTLSISGAASGTQTTGTISGTGTDPTSTPVYTPSHLPTLNPNYYDNSYQKVSCSNPNSKILPIPSALPTPFPTFGIPSRAPTVVGYTAPPTVANKFSFAVFQKISGISIETYNSNTTNYDRTLKAAIAATMTGVVPSNIINLLVVASSNRRLTALRTLLINGVNANISASYTVSVNLPEATPNSLANQLNNAVSNGRFNQYLGGYAEQYNATGLMGAICTAISEEGIPTASESTGMSPMIIIFITVLVVVVCCCCTCIGYFVYRYRIKSKLTSDGNIKAGMDSNVRTTITTVMEESANPMKKPDVGKTVGDDNM